MYNIQIVLQICSAVIRHHLLRIDQQITFMASAYKMYSFSGFVNWDSVVSICISQHDYNTVTIHSNKYITHKYKLHETKVHRVALLV